jgi:hypothetical protein
MQGSLYREPADMSVMHWPANDKALPHKKE